jgi:hypothetical protein
VVGKLFALGGEEPYRHARIWAREATSGPDRLRIGGGERPLEVIEELARLLVEPLYLLVVLSVARGGGTSGRYESNALTHSELAVFLEEFEDLFSNDARAEVWIGSTTGEGLLVLDEHDLPTGGSMHSRPSSLLEASSTGCLAPRIPTNITTTRSSTNSRGA